MGVSMGSLRRFWCVLLAVLLVGIAPARASITGSISGIVTDPSGSVIADANVTATERQTGVKTVIKTDGQGFYNFPSLAIGTYDVDIEQTGFKGFRKTGIAIDANSAVKLDVVLQVGATTEKMEITSDAVTIDTQSTQNGDVITGTKMTTVPLNGRAYTDLLSLQPGVVPTAYGSQAPGVNDRAPSGGLNSGNVSVNGQREAANGFMVNGANVTEGKNNGASVIPNLDSIAEFRIITNNFDSEYGNYSGGQITAVPLNSTAIPILRRATSLIRPTRTAITNAINSAEPLAARSSTTKCFSSPIIKARVKSSAAPLTRSCLLQQNARAMC